MENEYRQILEVESTDAYIALFGLNDENISLIREELGVEVFVHGTQIQLSGEEEKVELAKLAISKLLEILARGEGIDRTRIRYCIELAREGNADAIGEIMKDTIAVTSRGRQVKCKTLGQRKYVDAIKKNTCVFAIGPAGTGKTYLAIAMAVVALKNKDVEKIVLTRPAVEAGEKLGFLPGDLAQKVDPYLRPLNDALHEMMGVDAYQRLVERGQIEVAPLAYMRGRTLNDAFIILDEAQNTDLRANEDVSHTHGHEFSYGDHRRCDADRPTRWQKEWAGGGSRGIARCKGYCHRPSFAQGRCASRTGAGHCAGLRKARGTPGSAAPHRAPLPARFRREEPWRRS